MNNSYPHPVLGHNDDINNNFKLIDLKGPILENKLAKFSFSIKLDNETIQDLIQNKKASYATEVSCKHTYYKKIYTSSSPEFDIAISSKDIKGKVTVKLWVVADEIIHDYLPKNIHRDYGDAEFSIEPGDILAENQGFWFIAEKEFDALKAPTSSFIIVGKDLEEDCPMRVDWSDPNGRIVITLSSRDFDLYREICLDPDAKKILHSSIVLPVLIQGIIAIQEGEDSNYYNSRLDAVIHSKIQTKQIKNFETEQPILIAQEILKGPISRSLRGAHAPLSRRDEVDDE